MDYDILNNIVVTVDYYNHRICTVNWEIEEMVMDFVDITYVISGRAEYIINGTKYTVTAGDLLCIPYGSTRSATSSPDALMECYSINGKIRNINGEDITLPLPLICNIGLHKDILALYKNLNTVWTLRSGLYSKSQGHLSYDITTLFSDNNLSEGYKYRRYKNKESPSLYIQSL